MADFSQMPTKAIVHCIPTLERAAEREAVRREFLHDAGMPGSIKAIIEYQAALGELLRRVAYGEDMCEWCDDRVENGYSHGEGQCFCSQCGDPHPRVYSGVFCEREESCRACLRCCSCEDDG